jgi:hypothetical protein
MLNFKRNPTKLVLCATSKQLLAGVWFAGVYKGSQVFLADEAGFADFAVFLQQYRDAPIYILADAVEEDYRLERIPHTSGGAKHELIERKLNQFYRNLNYRTAYFVGREQDKRRDDRYLFTALSNADFMQAWVGTIQAAEMPVVGVYLLPMLSQVIVRQHKLMAPNILLCEKLSSGLRQTYLHNGRLRMSRLVADLPRQDNQLGYFYLVEIEKTRLYLISQRLILHETPLHLVLASATGNTSRISEAISQEQGLTCTDLNLSTLIRNLQLPATLVQQTPELMHMQLLVNGHDVDNLAPASLTHQHRIAQVKQGVYIAGISLAIIAIVTSIWIVCAGLMDKEAILQAEKDTFLQEQRYKEVAKDFPDTPVSANDLQIAVNIDDKIASFPTTPKRMMQVLSRALDNSPEIQIDRLRWLMATDANVKDQDSLINVADNKQNANNVALTLNPDVTLPNEMAFLTAEIVDFNGNYRVALDSVNRFVQALKQDQTVAWVTVLQEPVNVSSFANLQGSTADSIPGIERAQSREPALFKLQILLKPPSTILNANGPS